MKIHAPLFPLAVCLIAGITISEYLCEWTLGGIAYPGWTLGLILLGAGAAVTTLLYRWPRCQTAGIWLCFVLLGMTLGGRSLESEGTRQETRDSGLRQQFLEWRSVLLEKYHEWGVGDEAYGVVAAMTLGDKREIDKDTKETYRVAGASHILALSGLHLMIIYSVITLLVGWMRFRLLSQVIIVLAIWAFALLTGLSPSVTRSAAMITAYALLSLGYRERMSVNTLAFVAIIMLIISPSMLYDVGFQLSFMAVLSIVLWHPLLNGLIPLHVQQRHHWLSNLWGLITVSTAAQIGTAPLVAYYFGRLPVWFLLSNFIVIPLATVVLYLTLALVVFNWWTWAATLVAKVLTAVVVTMERGLAWVGALPYSSIDGIQLSVLRVYLIYIIIGSLFVAVSIRFPAIRRSV